MHPHLIVFSAIVYISVSNRIDFSSFLALTPTEYLYTIIIGFCSVSGLLLHMRAFQIAPASVPAPFQYTQIVWGIVFGFFIFGEVPSLRILAGAAIIASAGFATYFNNQSQEKRKGMPVNPNNYWPHLQSQKKI